MKMWVKRGTKVLLMFMCCHFTLEAGAIGWQSQEKMVADLDFMKHVLEVGYAPRIWKENHSKWNLNEALINSKASILSHDKITLKQFQQIVRDFLGSVQDYHVGVIFFSTESATLPFTIKGANGRYFIQSIDMQRLSPDVYPIEVGDEVIEFNGRPVLEVIAELKSLGGRHANPLTDQSLAEMTLTYRNGSLGDHVPKGPINVKIKSTSDGRLQSYQLMWNYQHERIKNWPEMSWINEGMEAFMGPTQNKGIIQQKKVFFNPIAKLHSHPLCGSKGKMSSSKSFVPPLGPIIETIAEDTFYAYIYRNEQGKNVGYVRIPHYILNKESDFEQFENIINMMQNTTEALVIDQVDNVGGYVLSLYALASMLTDYPLETPKHRLMINQHEVFEAFAMLDILNLIQSDEDAKLRIHSPACPKTYQQALFLKEFFRFIIDEWNAGRVLTNPIHIEGVDQINPHPRCRYTKPILVLINELDFSAGDFFAAIMKDNKRAKLFGTRTAGAGGYVRVVEFPNSNGIRLFTYTASIAERANKQPIEGIGVTPDIVYKVTEEDLQYGYQSYISAVNQVICDSLSSIPVLSKP